MESNSRTKFVSLSSSDDEDNRVNGLPKIVNTISLQDCADISFRDGADAIDPLYPECQIKEEPEDKEIIKKPEIKENGHATEIKREKEKKRIKLTQLATVDHHSKGKPKPSTSKGDDSSNVVDARRLALQESLFKTKDLFDTFLRVCQDQKCNDKKSNAEMERIVMKLFRAYEQTKPEFLGSARFQNILESETEKVNTSSVKPWLNLKFVRDEMKHERKTAAPKLKLGESEESQDGGENNEDEPVIECPKKRRHLKKLEKFLRALNLKIKKLEERELELDDLDNDDSAYIKLDRYRTQFTKCYSKICEIKGKLADADRAYLRKVSFTGTKYPHINRCIERYYNKHREFPDFQDIKKLVAIAVEQDNIQMMPNQVHTIAADAFKEFGEMLKRLRQFDDYDVIISYLDQQVDPARDNKELMEELNKNALLFRRKEQEVIDKFAAKVPGLDDEDDENSDSEPKKKKRKIMISSPQKRSLPSTSKQLSDSDSSDEDEEKVRPVKKKKLGRSLSSSSSESISDDEGKKKVKREPVEGKGKTLIGKKRIVKKGIKEASPKKVTKPKTSISSSEESAPEDTKDNFASYLGLQGSSVKTEMEPKMMKEKSDEDEIAGVQENRIINRPVENHKKSSNEKSSDSDSKEKFVPTLDMEVENVDSSSEAESVSLLENLSEPVRPSQTKSQSEIEPKRTPLLRKGNPSSKKKPSWTSDSDSEEVHSDEESANKSLSDAELSTGTKDLSSDSSDSENAKEVEKNDSDEDDSIVVLSEDVLETRTANVNRPASGSDSDDICILSQEPGERRTVAPRRSKPQRPISPTSGRNPRRPVLSFGPPTPTKVTPPRRLPVVATSTPRQRPPVVIQRRLSGDKRPKQFSLSSNGSKQATIPQTINGASRKIKSTSNSTATDRSIEIIDLE